jgi:hypothetical protein
MFWHSLLHQTMLMEVQQLLWMKMLLFSLTKRTFPESLSDSSGKIAFHTPTFENSLNLETELLFIILFCFFGNLFLKIGSGTPFRRVPSGKSPAYTYRKLLEMQVVYHWNVYFTLGTSVLRHEKYWKNLLKFQAESFLRSKATEWLKFQRNLEPASSNVKQEATDSSKTLIPIYQTTWCHISEGSDGRIHRCEDLIHS